MPEYQFTFVTTGFDIEDVQQSIVLEDAFDGDVSASHSQGRTEISFFDQKAPNALAAMKKMYRKLKKTFPGVQVQYVDEDLVSISDIAGRVGVTKSEIELLVKKCGTFPTPVGILGGGKRIWRWQDAAVCINALSVDEWRDAGMKIKNYASIFDCGGEYVDRQSVAAFMTIIGSDTQTRKQGRKKTAKKTKTAKKRTR